MFRKVLEDNIIESGAHRISGVLNLSSNFRTNIDGSEIENYYRRYATIDYAGIIINKKIGEKLEEVKNKGYMSFIYTDNSIENVISGMNKLGFNVSRSNQNGSTKFKTLNVKELGPTIV